MSIILLALRFNLLVKLSLHQITDFKNRVIRHFLHLDETDNFVQTLVKEKKITPKIESYLLKQLNKIVDQMMLLSTEGSV